MEVKPVPDKLVVLTFDDGNRSDIEFVAPLLRECGFGATFFITEGLSFLTDKQAHLTWGEVRQLHEMGFEIGNHTARHEMADAQSGEEFRAGVELLEKRFAEEGLPAPETFCYPAWRHTPEAVAVLAEKGYRFARRGVMPEYPAESRWGIAYDPADDHPLLVPTAGSSGPNWRFRGFVEAVQKARDGKIAVLTFHGVPDLNAPWVNTEPAFFEKCVAYLEDNGYTVVALRDLAEYVDFDRLPHDPYEAIDRRLGLHPPD